ncbi:MAG: ABC transporter permease [Gammaproteobacteria bacterium]|nr:ABC transporter permease [Gammaproteobacteria bacterium]NIR97654.1 ABC transporter permease [Gammaproteobacteria bacterium]NIT63315.1 ABC transporter permease [Gammaproteobacteria bacterium]NIV20233.1 ABC transporter permease [Gammaproteobacteria bacterium]NIX10650.1 ABC transporter permease [Gammaproteobacteria bacterium]
MRAAALLLSTRRISALVLRNAYLMRASWPRVLELVYWPTVQMILWGFITRFFATNSSWVAEASGVLIAAVLLWDVMFRGNLGVSLSFFEELYSRNLGHLFASPLRPCELVLALLLISLLRTLIGVGGAAVLAIPLYGYSIFGMGLALLAFFANLLVMGWSIGLLVSSLVMRYGLGAESLAWVAIFAVAPVSGIYYPIDTLPPWLQLVAAVLPSSHVFEGMRSVLFGHGFRGDLLVQAVSLNVAYLALAVAVFLLVFRTARRRGLLLSIGE